MAAAAAAGVTSEQLQEGAGRLRRVTPQQQRRAMPQQLQEAISGLRPVAATQEATSKQAGSDDEPSFGVILQYLDGTHKELQVRSRDLVREVQAQVSLELGVTDSRVKLLSGQTPLNRHDELGAHGICEGAVITAIIVPPVYEGTQLYNRVMDGMRGSRDMGLDERRQAMEDVMEKKAALNDAFASLVRLRSNA